MGAVGCGGGGGKAVQVDPIKSKLKPPGTERLTPKCDMLLSTPAFKFNLRRHTAVVYIAGYIQPEAAAVARRLVRAVASRVGGVAAGVAATPMVARAASHARRSAACRTLGYGEARYCPPQPGYVFETWSTTSIRIRNLVMSTTRRPMTWRAISARPYPGVGGEPRRRRRHHHGRHSVPVHQSRRRRSSHPRRCRFLPPPPPPLARRPARQARRLVRGGVLQVETRVESACSAISA